MNAHRNHARHCLTFLAMVLAMPGVVVCTNTAGTISTDNPGSLPDGFPGDDLEPLEEEADINVTLEDLEPVTPDDSSPESPSEARIKRRPYNCPPCESTDCRSSDYVVRNAFGYQTTKKGTRIYGGTGDDRGPVSGSVLLNCGMRKKLPIAGSPSAVYAWHAPVAGDYESGWILEDALEHAIKMPTRNNPYRSYDHHVYKLMKPENVQALRDKYHGIRVSSDGKPEDNLVAHYLPRLDVDGSNYALNVTQSVPGTGPGLANDTYSIDAHPKITGTMPISETVKRIALYKKMTTGKAAPLKGCHPKKPDKACGMTFLYVKIRGRYGWVAKLAFADMKAGNSIKMWTPLEHSTPLCGGEGMACCATSMCGDSLVCQGATCVTCGGLGEPCCDGDCGDGVCLNGSCQSCGDLGQPCCDAAMCEAGTCIGGSCQPCGAHATACCPTSAPCSDPDNNCTNGACGSVCYARCQDGNLIGPYNAASKSDCLTWSDGACIGDGGKARVELNYISIFDNGICGGYHQTCCLSDQPCAGGNHCHMHTSTWQRCE